jgi:hypothetical protein
MAYTNLNVANLTTKDKTNKSKYVVETVGKAKPFYLPKDKHAPSYQFINTDATKVDFICTETLEDKPK